VLTARGLRCSLTIPYCVRRAVTRIIAGDPRVRGQRGLRQAAPLCAGSDSSALTRKRWAVSVGQMIRAPGGAGDPVVKPSSIEPNSAKWIASLAAVPSLREIPRRHQLAWLPTRSACRGSSILEADSPSERAVVTTADLGRPGNEPQSAGVQWRVRDPHGSSPSGHQPGTRSQAPVIGRAWPPWDGLPGRYSVSRSLPEDAWARSHGRGFRGASAV
jgi:hypothetical protein